MNNYRPVIGLEIHVELKTETKMFCNCKNDPFNAGQPNIYVCPVCLGMPGALPVPNKKAVEWTVLIGKSLNCKINGLTKFDRKHYFYPDLPKGYQISQYDKPIATGGWLELSSNNSQDRSRHRITRIHLEEDTGKLLHLGLDTLVDFNRSGVPLVEIVTEPDFSDAGEVKHFLEELHTLIRYLGISDADMEKGSMRIEPNISVANVKVQMSNVKAKVAKLKLPKYKVEVKNINSFNFVKKAIEYEIERQIDQMEEGKVPNQETRGYDSKKGITFSQRSKEEAHDYRYFPEPDIPPLTFSKKYIESIIVPELPQEKVNRFIKEFGLRRQDVFVLTREKDTVVFFEKVISNMQFLISKQTSKFKIPNFRQSIVNFIINKKISTDISVEKFVEKAFKLLRPVETDEKVLTTSINRLIEANKKAVEDYKKGKENVIMFLVGLVMREMKGKADAKVVKKKILEKLT